MGVHIKPVIACNLACSGCYETELFRKHGNRPETYQIEKVIATAAQGPSGSMVLHGGEITLLPLVDLRKLCEAGKAQGRQLVMQTNGLILTDAHLALYQEFQVSVGVSINGPGPLNRDRVPHAAARVDQTTAQIEGNIERLRAAGVSVSIIVVLSVTNSGTEERLEQLIAWAADLTSRLGIRNFRFNPLFNGGDVELSPDRMAEVYVRLCAATFEDPARAWNPFREFTDNLWGLGLSPCWMATCDPYNTAAVHAVLGDGSVGNCLRTAHDGIAYLKTPDRQPTRQTILSQIPFAEGGCGGCRYWRVCHGGCPAEGEGGDWRNRTRFCSAYIATYGLIERRLRAMLPNWTPVTEWTGENKEEVERLVRERKPPISALQAADPTWSRRPSTYELAARTKR